MYKKIINSNNLGMKSKIKNLFKYFRKRRGAQKPWENRHKRVFAVNNDYKKPCDQNIETEHKKIWQVFRKNPDLTTLRICKNISGIQDPQIIPEDIYVSDIEPSLIADKSVDYIGIKSFYNRWFPNGIFPKDFLHRIDGQYMNEELEGIDFDEFKSIAEKIKYPVVMKPNKDTYGGKDIQFVNSSNELLNLASERANFVVQKKIRQHDFFKRFNPDGLNTIKIYLYRSVVDNKLHILSMALRMGKDGSLDNESSGGINSLIKTNDYLNGYAVDKYGTKYMEHPNTKVKFDCKIPSLDELRSLALKVGSKVFYSRVFGLDACYDINGNWRIIELNTYSQTIRFSQYGGKPFLGDFTDEVIEYCKKNHWALN